MRKCFVLAAMFFRISMVFAQDTGLSGRVSEYVKPFIENQVFSGTILIAKGDKIIYHSAFGYSDHLAKIRNTTGTHYRIASLTKQFTQIALEIMEVKGYLKRADTLSKYLDDFPNANKITVNQLINHRSGIKDINSLPEYDALSEKRYSTQDVYNIVKTLPLDFEPGSSRRYSNSGYVVLAMLIEKLSGISYFDFVKKEILQPLGMRDTYMDDGKVDPASEAIGQMADPFETGLKKSISWDPTIKMGGGCLTSTAGDIFKLFHAAYTGRIGIPPGAVPDSARVDAYTGNSPGFTTIVKRYFKDDLYIVVLANNHSRAGWNVGHGLADVVMHKAATANVIPAHTSPDLKNVSRFFGKYQSGSFQFEIYMKNGKMLLSAAKPDGPDPYKTSRVYQVSESSFFIPYYWAVVSFKSKDNMPVEVVWTDIL